MSCGPPDGRATSRIGSAPGVTWNPGDTIPLGGRTLRVVGVRDDDADQPPALIVEDAEFDAA